MPIDHKPSFRPDERMRFRLMAEADIRSKAQMDPDAPPLSAESLRRAVALRQLRLSSAARRDRPTSDQKRASERYTIVDIQSPGWLKNRLQTSSGHQIFDTSRFTGILIADTALDYSDQQSLILDSVI